MNRNALWAALGALLFLLLSAAAPAQMQTVYANNITDATGLNKVASATITFTPTLCPAELSGFRLGGGGQAVGLPVSAVVTQGQFAISLANVALTYPQNLGFHVVAVDNTSGATLLDYSCVQPSVTAAYASTWCGVALNGCDFDLYPPNIATVAPSTNSAPIYNTYNSQQVIDVDTFNGADFGAKLAEADATYAGQAVTFGISHAETCSSAPVTLGAFHSLSLFAPLTMTGGCYITPTTHNTVQCFGSGSLLNGQMSNYGTNVLDPFFYAPAGSAEVEHLHITGCWVDGKGTGPATFAQLFMSVGPSTDVQVDHNDLYDASIFTQNGASASNPSARLDISHNKVTWDQGYAPGIYPVTIYGAASGLLDANLFTATTGGVELFASTSNGSIGSGNPSYTQILTSGLADFTISNNQCLGLQGTTSCVFTSTAARIHVVGNFTDGAGDVAYDLEATVDSDATANYAYNDPTACVGSFFSSVNNHLIDNVCVNAGLGILIKNAGAQTTTVTTTIVQGNSIKSTSGMGIGMYLESNEHMVIDFNKFFDAQIAYGGSYVNSQEWRHNRMFFDAALASGNLGGAQAAGTGLPTGNENDGQPIIVEDNEMITTVAQASINPCIGSAQSWSTSVPVVFIKRNSCIGPWSVDLAVNSGQTNTAFPVKYILQGNTWNTGTIVTTNTNAVVPQVVSWGGNCALSTGTCN